MMKWFGVEFEIENEDFEDDNDGFTEPYFDYRLWEIESPETISSLLDVLDCNGRIYVQNRNNHIFEPKEGDFGVSSTGVLQTIYDSEDGWVSTVNHARSGSIENSKIIMRDSKLFFMPEMEVENA